MFNNNNIVLLDLGRYIKPLQIGTIIEQSSDDIYTEPSQIEIIRKDNELTRELNEIGIINNYISMYKNKEKQDLLNNISWHLLKE